MKKIVLLVGILFAVLEINAQIKPKPSLKPPTKKIKGSSVGTPDIKLVGCDLTLSEYKRFMHYVLSKPDGQSRNWSTLMPGLSLKYSQGVTYLYFGKAKGHYPMPSFNSHVALSDNGVYGGIMLEGWGTLENIDNNSYTFSLHYQEGNYDNIVEVTEIYRQGNNTYAEVKRPNGSLEQVRIVFHFVLENGCLLPTR